MIAFEKPDSPFTPGRPVPADFFVGRTEQVKELNRYVSSSLRGKHLESILIYGDRGIGKSSLARYVSAVAEREYNIVTVHVSLTGSTSLRETIKSILIRIFEEIGQSNWFDKVKGFFGKYIKRVGFWGVEIELKLLEEGLNSAVTNFDVALKNIIDQIKKAGKKGLLIVLDDINGLTDTPDFANWYKGFSDGAAIRNVKLPVAIMLLSTTAQRERLCELQPSLMRIFRPMKVERLSDEDISYFFQKTFSDVDMTVESESLDIMVHHSSGLPTIMQEIGDCVFWLNENGIINENDAFAGIFIAADKVGEKYLTPTVYYALKSSRYRSILRKLVSKPTLSIFKKSDIANMLNAQEKKVLDNFLRKLKKLGIIENDLESGRGAYRFVNELFPIYIWLEAITFRTGKNKKLK